MTRTTMARGTPVPQRRYEVINVQSACCEFERIAATIPPEAEATIVETIGSSQTAVIEES